MTGFMLYQKLNGKWRDDKMSDKYQNTELIPEERAAYLLEELSLDEKVAQLNCVFPFDKASYDFAGINAHQLRCFRIKGYGAHSLAGFGILHHIGEQHH